MKRRRIKIHYGRDVAQLVARNVRDVEVASSNLVIPTTRKKHLLQLTAKGAFFLLPHSFSVSVSAGNKKASPVRERLKKSRFVETIPDITVARIIKTGNPLIGFSPIVQPPCKAA